MEVALVLELVIKENCWSRTRLLAINGRFSPVKPILAILVGIAKALASIFICWLLRFLAASSNSLGTWYITFLPFIYVEIVGLVPALSTFTISSANCGKL